MKKAITISTLLMSLAAISWVNYISEKGSISWQASSKMYIANGTFSDWEVKNFSMTGSDITSISLDLEVKMASVTEKNDKLAQHLRQEDYFDVAKYPVSTYHVSHVEKTDSNYKAQFINTIKGITDTTSAFFTVESMVPLKVKGYTYINRPKHMIGLPLEKTSGTTQMVRVDFTWEK